MRRAWHQHKKADGHMIVLNDGDNLDPEILLSDLEKLTVLLLGKMKMSSLYSQVCWGIDKLF